MEQFPHTNPDDSRDIPPDTPAVPPAAPPAVTEEERISGIKAVAREQAPPPQRAARMAAVLGGVLVAIIGLGLLVGGEPRQFVVAGLNQYVPFLLLAFVGMLGLRQNWARIATYIYALLLQGGVAFVTINFLLLGLADGPIDTPEGMQQNLTSSDALLLALGLLLLVLLFAACTSVLLRRVRVWLARYLPIDPADYTHTIALWVVLFVTSSALMQLILLGGQPPILSALNTGSLPADALGNRSDLGQSLDLIYGLIWMLPLALVAAGWPLVRTLGATLRRLGLVLPSWRQVAFGLLASVVLAVGMGFVTQFISMVWQWFGWPETDVAAFEQLLGGLLTPVGAVVIGVTAGLGEELAVRGLLQPRLGLLLSNVGFTAVHAYQYGFDALLVVFTLGMLLGVVRNRTNTTTAALVHGSYNALTVLLSLAGW